MYYIFNAIFAFLAPDTIINAWGIAGVHTVFKILSVLIMAPFYKQLAKLSELTIRDSKDGSEVVNLLDERLFETPAIAVARATEVTYSMADLSIDALNKSLRLYKSYDQKLAYEINDLEGEADKYEESLGSYLVKLSACYMDESDSLQITKLLHLIGDLERISDHAVNIVESAEEIKDKNIRFSDEANRELGVIMAAVEDIVNLTYRALKNNDVALAAQVESLEEVIDDLRDQIKLNHIRRLQKSECTIEHGFVLSDLLTNFERVSDHCSNIASCVAEIAQYDALDLHKYVHDIKEGNEGFVNKYNEYKTKYTI